MSRPVVTLVGRPNVGKSSLFNRLLGRRKALVQDTPGVTRDRNYAVAELDGRDILLCDTGGFEDDGALAGELMAGLIRDQALVAIDESDVLVFIMDLRAGATPGDEFIWDLLRASGKPVVVALNKADHPSVEVQSADFYRLGLPGFLLVSAEHGLGLSELAEAVIENLPDTDQGMHEDKAIPEPEPKRGRIHRSRRERREDTRRDSGGRLYFIGDDMVSEPTTQHGPGERDWDQEQEYEGEERYGRLVPGVNVDEEGLEVVQVGPGSPVEVDPSVIPEDLPEEYEGPSGDGFVPRIALLGRPNVGKSTLLNRLLGYQRSITSPVAGTTHDTVDTFVEHEGERFVLIDTAGIRRKARVTDRLEQLTVGKAIRVIEAAHVCLLLVDGVEGVTDQEAKIGALIADRGRALVVVVNKWDLSGKGQEPREQFLHGLRRRFPHLAFADVLFVSAKTGRSVGRIWGAIARANEGHTLRVRTSPLNRWLGEVVAAHPPPMEHHRPIRFYYGVQTGQRPPTFTLFCSKPAAVKEPYRRYLLNQLRAAWPATGSPVRLLLKDRSGS